MNSIVSRCRLVRFSPLIMALGTASMTSYGASLSELSPRWSCSFVGTTAGALKPASCDTRGGCGERHATDGVIVQTVESFTVDFVKGEVEWVERTAMAPGVAGTKREIIARISVPKGKDVIKMHKAKVEKIVRLAPAIPEASDTTSAILLSEPGAISPVGLLTISGNGTHAQLITQGNVSDTLWSRLEFGYCNPL